MPFAFRWLCRVAWLLVPLVLVILAIPRMNSGIALELAFPVPDYMTSNVVLPRNAYRAATSALSRASDHDGNSGILRGEADILSGISLTEPEKLIRTNLTKVPSSVRGWTLLAERLSFREPQRASAVLDHALALSALDYTLVGRQTRLAARLWADLSESGRGIAQRQVNLLWSEPTLRAELSLLLATENGESLISQAFSDRPEAREAVIDWVDAYRQRIFGQE